MWINQAMYSVSSLILLAMVCVKAFAFFNALLYRPEVYEAAAKLTKVGWCLILGVGLAAQLVLRSPLGLINLVFLVAAFVYLADVRPALRELTRR